VSPFQVPEEIALLDTDTPAMLAALDIFKLPVISKVLVPVVQVKLPLPMIELLPVKNAI
jgi:hypothetical protein